MENLGNAITYYDRNFNSKDMASDFIYAIWDRRRSFHIASFKTEEQLKKFCNLLNFSYSWTEEREDGFKSGITTKKIYDDYKDERIDRMTTTAINTAYLYNEETGGEMKDISAFFLEHHYEYKCFAYSITKENLEKAVTFKSLSNGHIVDNLFTSDETEVKIYRCNPNAKNFYFPLPTQEHIRHQRENGVY